MPPPPAVPFTPYMLNASEFPSPDVLVNNSSGVFEPQFTTTEFQNQTIYELAYAQFTPSASHLSASYSVHFMDGRYDPKAAVCILNQTGCGTGVSHLPIYWGAPWRVFGLGNATMPQALAVGSSGSLVATAISSNNRTRLLYSYDFGQSQTWADPTPTTIPGAQPKLAVSPTAIDLTTVTPNGGVYATVFQIGNMPPPTTPGRTGFFPPVFLPPAVTSISPYYAAPGSIINIYGTQFNSVTQVTFGTHTTTNFTLVGPNHLHVTVPSYTSSTPVNVTVTAIGGTSAKSAPYDWFTISSTPPQPRVLSVVPNKALPNTTVAVIGYAFNSSQSVTFSGVSALGYTYSNETSFTTTVPWGVGGPVDLEVRALSQNSVILGSDHFTYAVQQSILPNALDAAPLILQNGTTGATIYGVFDTDKNSSQTELYNSSNGGNSFTHKALAAYTTSAGSAIFNQIGSTRLYLGGGVPGEVASIGFGQSIFGMFTTNLGNRTVVETEGSSDGGRTWNGPYYTAPLLGSVDSPYVTVSPSGLVYATWAENGAGPWQIDQAVFSESGRLLLGPQVIPGSGGSTGNSALDPTVAFDGLDRPLYVWGWSNQQTQCPSSLCASATVANVSIDATGGFLNASVATSDLSNAFNRTVPTDFVSADYLWSNSISHNLTPFRTNLTSNLNLFRTDLGARKPTCTLQNLALERLLPNLSHLAPAPAFFGVSGHCSVSPIASGSQIANLSGPDSANQFLGVYSDWLLESLGYGSLKEPRWVGAPSQGSLVRGIQLTPPLLRYPPNPVTNSTGPNWRLAVQPMSLNPNTVFLNLTGNFGSAESGGTVACVNGTVHSRTAHYFWTYPTWANETVKVVRTGGSPYSGIFHPAGWMPSPYVTSLPSGFEGTYNVTLNVTYQEWESEYDGCDPGTGVNFYRIDHNFTLNPHFLNISLLGTMTSYLEGVPADLVVHELGNTTGGNATIYAAWNNSVLGNYSVWSNGTGISKRLNSTTFSFAQNTGLISLQANRSYNLTGKLFSVAGGYNVSGWSPRLSTGILSSNSSRESFNSSQPWTCAMTLKATNPLGLYWNSTRAISGVNTSNATLTWWSDVNGVGWATYNDSDDSPYTITAQSVDLTGRSGLVPNALYPIMYRVQIHGLSPWGVYRVQIGVSGNQTGAFSGGGSCLTFSNTATWHFHTPSIFSISEQDFPYDSITQQGGGAQFRWSIPTAFAAAATYLNGSIRYCKWTGFSCASNTSILMPLPNVSRRVPGAELFGNSYGLTQINDSFVLNTTGLAINSLYNASLELNFTYQGVRYNASSLPLTFWYEKDTSNDGLTDWEKIHGWEVTTQSGNGSWNTPVWVTSQPSLYATNGLVNDFVEKEFALNPATVDSAGSHMLDTWNLTFDLGGKSQALKVPSNSKFHYWYESGNSSADYNPNKVCQYFVTPGTTCQLGTVATNRTNLTGADSSTWASRVFWNKSSLWAFLNYSGVRNASWLRAVLGNTSTDWTLTVEGKLSWGANPLATSTPGDGIPDGSRVNPLYDEDLVINSLSANIYNANGKGCPPTGGSTNYFGWAPRFFLNYSTGGVIHNELPGATGNYTRQANDSYNGATDGKCGSLSNWQTAIPISATTQNQTLQAQLVLHYTAGGANQLWAERFNLTSGTSYKSASVTFDTVQGSTGSLHCTAKAVCQFAGSNGTLNFSLSIIPAGVKDSTFLWLPNDNGTLSSLPWGLKRYVGEQGFNLIEVDQTSGAPLTVSRVPYAQNGSRSYSLTLPSGLSSILIPRAQFLESSLGRGVLLDSNLGWNSSNPPPPLLNSSANSMLSPFGSMSNPLLDLACYWQNRSINSTTGTPLCGSTEKDTSWSSPENIATVATNASDGVNSGGMPASPGLESSTQAGAAVQSILTLNISNQTELVLLLAGLMDNATGGLNGSFIPVTYLVPTLGLAAVVTDSLANATFNSSGLFAKPTSSWVPPPPPPCTSIWCNLANAVSGIVSVGGQLFSYVWNGATAITSFVDDHLPTWLKNLGGWVVSRSALILSEAGAFLKTALLALVSAVTLLVQTLLNASLSPFFAARDAYGKALNSAVDPTTSEGIWEALGLTIFLVGIGVSAATVIGLNILKGIDFGANFIISICISLVLSIGITAITYSLPGVSSPSPQMVSITRNFTNGYNNQTTQSANWSAWSSAFSFWENGASDSYAFMGLKQAWADTEVTLFQYGAQVYSFAFALVSSAMAFYANTLSGGDAVLATDSAILLAATSVVLEVPALVAAKKGTKLGEEDHTMDLIIFGLDLSDLGVSVAELSVGK